jgi:hypothetical protein
LGCDALASIDTCDILLRECSAVVSLISVCCMVTMTVTGSVNVSPLCGDSYLESLIILIAMLACCRCQVLC